jgi:hypothetical protein
VVILFLEVSWLPRPLDPLSLCFGGFWPFECGAHISALDSELKETCIHILSICQNLIQYQEKWWNCHKCGRMWNGVATICCVILSCHLLGSSKGNHDVAQVLSPPANMRAEDLRWKTGMLHIASHHVPFHFLLVNFRPFYIIKRNYNCMLIYVLLDWDLSPVIITQ